MVAEKSLNPFKGTSMNSIRVGFPKQSSVRHCIQKGVADHVHVMVVGQLFTFSVNILQIDITSNPDQNVG